MEMAVFRREIFRREKYYTRGTPEYNRRFVRQIFVRRSKKIMLKTLLVIIFLIIVMAFIFWMFLVLKAKII